MEPPSCGLFQKLTEYVGKYTYPIEEKIPEVSSATENQYNNQYNICQRQTFYLHVI